MGRATKPGPGSQNTSWARYFLNMNWVLFEVGLDGRRLRLALLPP